jgi:hypothetical protein
MLVLSAGVFVLALALSGAMLGTAPCAAAPAGTAGVEQTLMNTPMKDKWAVIVGISNFAKPSLNLKYAAKDARDFRDFLISKCHFAADHIKLLTNEQATKNRILDVMGDSWLPRVTLPDDLVVIFISSHGSPSELDMRGVNYIVAHDTNPDKLFTTGISLKDLSQVIKDRVHSNRALIILDACHSGGASESKGIQRTGNVDAAALAQGTGHMVLASSSKSQSSWESKKYPNGVFTHTLIEALQSKGEQTKLIEAFSHLKDTVQQEVVAERGVMQTPVLEMSKWQGRDLLLAAKPVAPRKPMLEPDSLDLDSDTTPSAPIATMPSATRTSTPIATTSPSDRSPATPSNPLSTTSSNPFGTANTANIDSAIPDLKGVFIGPAPYYVQYNVWQRGHECGWELPQFQQIAKGIINADGRSMTYAWSGPNGVVTTNIARLDVDGNNRVVRMTSQDGAILSRAPANAGQNFATTPSQSGATQGSRIPDVSGYWVGSTGGTYDVWQNGRLFGWAVPADGEEGRGEIDESGKQAACMWTGRLASGTTFAIETDKHGRAIRLIGANGIVLKRGR